MVVVPDPANSPSGPQVNDPLMVTAPVPSRVPVKVTAPISETGPAAVTVPLMSTVPVPTVWAPFQDSEPSMPSVPGESARYVPEDDDDDGVPPVRSSSPE